ncbi:MAG TPA: SusC/RagA family TonB-linked outer membrane protein, partial [Prolixibacteraceae bacterium]|nr:SusC/RagA family TonB-linked outer membrane protein [Prolixibacteraceae bacterium]
MKKDHESYGCRYVNNTNHAAIKKMFRMARLTLFFCLLGLMQVTAKNSYSQLTRISLSAKDEKLEDIFETIENETEFYFLYNKDLVDVEQKASVNAENKTIKDVLDEVLADKDIHYSVYDRQIVLSNLENTNSSQNTTITVTGNVTDESGTPLPGVTVSIKGTTTGTVSDVNGKYILSKVPNDAILVYSFVGMRTLEVDVNQRSVINVTMEPTVIGLDEIVAIGYGTVRKADVTGSVASVSEDDFKDKTLTNISQALVGRVAGLDVVSSGNDPGAGAQIRLRGRRSFVASNDPLIILDGLPYYGSINDINPYDITNIDVLKDASSTAIYGSQGANGVIIITTKRGKIGKAKFSVESFGGVVAVHGKLPVYNGAEFAERGREAARAAGSYPDDGQIHDDYDQQLFTSSIEYDNMKAGNSVDWQDMLLQNGYQQKHQISVSGGSEAVKYNFAGNIYDEEGIIPTDKFSRFSLRSNLDFTISPKFTVGTSVMLQYNIRNSKIDAWKSFEEAWQASPLGTPYDEEGNPNFDPSNDGYRKNPLSDLLWDDYRSDYKRWSAFTHVFAEYKILPSLTYRLNLGANIDIGTEKTFAGPYTLSRRGDISNATIKNNVNTRNTYESILTFNKKINDHHIQITGVHS